MKSRPAGALSVQLQWRWRGFNRHRSVKGADRLCCNYSGHKRVFVSRRHFILVHILSPLGQPGLWLSREQSEITVIALTRRLAPLDSPHRHIGTTVKHTHTHSLAHALTTEEDPSQWSSVFSEKNKKTGYEKNMRRHLNYST